MLMVDGAPPMSPDGTPAGDGDHVPTPFDYDRDAGRYRLGMRLSRSYASRLLTAAVRPSQDLEVVAVRVVEVQGRLRQWKHALRRVR